MGMIAKHPIRVLVIDDSITMRTLYRNMLSGWDDLILAGEAKDGPSGLRLAQELHPDVVVLDVNMPGMDGLEVLSQLHAMAPRLPVLMCSTLTQRGAAVTLDALFRGAADYVAKPQAQSAPRAALEEFRNLLLTRIRALCARLQQDLVVGPVPVRDSAPDAAIAAESAPVGVVVVGASTGGPQALEAVLSALPADFSAPILIAQHIPPLFVPLLADRLQKCCPLRVREAAVGEPVCAGSVWIARGDWHLRVRADAASVSTGMLPQARLHLEQDAPIHYCRPSADALFVSAAQTYGAATLAVVLTGMGSDATDGARAVRASGGSVLVQDAGSSTIWGMPGSVAQAGLANAVLPLDSIAAEMVRRTGGRQSLGVPFAGVPNRNAVRAS
jgi:two-component system chemotaxis response regulator CheB